MSSDTQPQPFTGDIIPLGFGGTQIVITDSILLFLTTLWVAMRLYSRHIRKIRIPLEDWIIIAALIVFYGFVIVSFLMVFLGGFGEHLYNLSPFHIERALKLAFASQILYALSLTLVKCSICLMLIRIFFVPGFKKAAICAMVLAALWGIMTVLIGLFICQPFAFNWDPTIPGGKCGNQNAAFASVGVVDILTDLFIMILPIPMVLKLHLPTSNKIGLCSVFGFGLLTMVIAAVRTVFAFRVDFTDFTFSARNGHILSVAEVAVAIIVACSPILRPLFDKIFHSISTFGSRGQTYANSYANSHQRSAIGGKASKPRPLYSMDDEVALNQLDNRGNAVTTYVSGGKDGSEISIEADSSDKRSDKSAKGIQVTTTVSHVTKLHHEGSHRGPSERF